MVTLKFPLYRQTYIQELNNDVQAIIEEKISPISKEEEIIAVIDSCNGFQGDLFQKIAVEDYPVILTQKTNLIATNYRKDNTKNGFGLISELFSKSQQRNASR